MDSFCQEISALASPTALFRSGALINERLRTAVPVVGILGQNFEKLALSTKQHKRLIHGDARQPGRESRLFLKVVEMKEGLVKALLRHIFGILPVIGYPLRHGENSLLVTENPFPESLSISVLCGSHQRAVGVFAYSGSIRRFHYSSPSHPSATR